MSTRLILRRATGRAIKIMNDSSEYAEIRLPAQLYDVRERGEDALVSTLYVKTAALTGAISLTLHCLVGGAVRPIRGHLPKGLILTLGGNDYTLAAQATITGQADEIAVTIESPGLLADAAVSAAVTVPAYASFTSVPVEFGGEQTIPDRPEAPAFIPAVIAKPTTFDVPVGAQIYQENIYMGAVSSREGTDDIAHRLRLEGGH